MRRPDSAGPSLVRRAAPCGRRSIMTPEPCGPGSQGRVIGMSHASARRREAGVPWAVKS